VNSGPLFGLSVLMGFGAFGIVTKIYLLASLRAMRRDHALTAPLVPNIFRFIGLGYPGCVGVQRVRHPRPLVRVLPRRDWRSN
jgi:hypothetical protein